MATYLWRTQINTCPHQEMAISGGLAQTIRSGSARNHAAVRGSMCPVDLSKLMVVTDMSTESQVTTKFTPGQLTAVETGGRSLAE